jgi:putative PEP-CTERM system histidine kinase
MSGYLLAYTAAAFGAVLAACSVLRKRQSMAGYTFAVGMLLYAAQCVLAGLDMQRFDAGGMASYQSSAFLVGAIAPSVWLAFSLVYSRGNYREFLLRWWPALVLFLVAPVVLFALARPETYIPPGQADGGPWLRFDTPLKAANILVLAANVLVLMNLEKTFRATVGTLRWRVKFSLLGLALIFAVNIYTRIQALLFSGQGFTLSSLESGALVVGCLLVGFSYLRSGFAEIDIYPSHAVLNGSLTVLLVGAYLLVVGVLAQFIGSIGGAGSFQAQSFFLLLAIAALTILFFSERLRERIRHFVSKNFKAPRHDFRKVWTSFSQRTSGVLDREGLCDASSRLISQTFNALSVTIWLINDKTGETRLGGLTSKVFDEVSVLAPPSDEALRLLEGLGQRKEPFAVDSVTAAWTTTLKTMSPAQFHSGERRICVPLWARDRLLGVILLADRVYGTPYSAEEFDLLQCIGAQVADDLLNVQLAGELLQAKELEAFQTVSAFFVHDLKNTASSLGLMLKNLPVHFADPAFREDALRGVGKTVDRINQLIGGLGVLRNRIEIHPVRTDLNKLVQETLSGLNGSLRSADVQSDLTLTDPVPLDREQIQSVLTNLLLNSAEALSANGTIRISTTRRDKWAVLSVADNGSGMSPAFLRDNLFRPFQTTKKKGLGIGMFQSRMIVEAHHGSIQVESEQGKGSTFRVILPI